MGGSAFRAGRGDYARSVQSVFDGDRNSVQRTSKLPAGALLVGGSRISERLSGADLDNRIEPRVDLLDPQQVSNNYFLRGNLPLADSFGKLSGRQMMELNHTPPNYSLCVNPRFPSRRIKGDDENSVGAELLSLQALA